MAITQFTTPVAQRTDPAAVFIVRADTLVGELPDFVDEMNDEIVLINASADTIAASLITVVAAEATAVAAANFKGGWADLTGALDTPASVLHAGAYWLLLDDLADVTASEPASDNAEWGKIDFISESRELTAGTGLTGGGDLTADRTFSVDFATVANIRAGLASKAMDADKMIDACAPVTSSGTGTYTIDLDAGIVFQRTQSGATTLGTPSNQTAGQSGVIYFIQDGTGGRTLAYASAWKLLNGTPAIDTSANAVNVFSYYVRASGQISLAYLGAEG